MAQKIIPDSEYNEQEFKDWEKTVTITRYEHDFEKKERKIDYTPNQQHYEKRN